MFAFCLKLPNSASPPEMSAARRVSLSTKRPELIFRTACLFGALLFIRVATAQTDTAAKFTQAEILVRNHEWDQGIAILEPLLKADQTNLKLLNLVGLAYTGKGDAHRADQFFEAALKIRPDFLPALKNLAINEAALGEIAPARRHLEAAGKLAPTDPVINLYLGEIFYRQQDFRSALKYFTLSGILINRNPDLRTSMAVTELKTDNRAVSLEMFLHLPPETLSPESQFASGAALADAGLFDQAIPYLEAARTTGPANENITYDLALCYLSVKRFPEATTLLEGLSSSGHETSENDNLLAEAFEAQHETQKAVDTLRRAIALNPDDDNNYLAFASLCMDHQAFDDARKVLVVGIAHHPKSSQLFFERGILDAMQNHYDLAEQDFQTSSDLAPTDSSAYIGLGVTFLETGDSAKAIPFLRKRLKDQPDNANFSYLLGEALMRSGAQDGTPALAEAQTYFERAVRLDPRLVEPRISLGTIYLRIGRTQDAVVQLEKARQLDPTAKSAYSHLAIAYRRLGEQDKSKEVLAALKDINDRERSASRQPISSTTGAPAPTSNSKLNTNGSN